ncbi:MAG: oligosaccharide flippase family protein [Candidatus Dojkabacteria bacterium]|jgi:O-antigen/teichoic acid export membrane protein|nr:oligosaccharide flippase family protein [Candidatus Dojkabacteria bacterium]
MNLSKYFKGDQTFLKNIFITIFIGVIVNFLAYLFNIYLARNLGSTDFGLYNAAIGIIYLVQIPAIAIQTAITKKVAQKRDFNLEKFKIQSILQLSVIAVVLSLIFILFGEKIAAVANIPMKYILPLSLALFGAIVSPIPKGFLLGLEKIFTLNIILLLETILKFALGFFAISRGMDITIPILANVIPALITLVIVLPFLKTGSVKIPTKKINIQYKGVVLLFTTFLLLNAPFTLDLILVNPEVRASYGALSLIGKIVYFASITIAGVMISRLANQKDELRKRTLIISLIFSALTGLAISAVYFLFTKEIVDIVFKGMYLEITPYIALYGIAMTAYSVSYMAINSLLIKDSYIHIYFLLLLVAVQLILYRVHNSTLQDAFINQIVVYSLLFIFVFFILIFYFFKKNGKPKKDIKK